jgi:hypothetical protein
MPAINSEKRDRIAGLRGTHREIREHLDAPPEPPVVNVEAPKISVPVTVPPATVNIPPSASPKAWTFDVTRDSNDRIVQITATPNPTK